MNTKTATRTLIAMTMGFIILKAAPSPSSDLESGKGGKTSVDSSVVVRISPATLRIVQMELNRLGFHAGHVDGLWGPITHTALRNFQQSVGLEPTGLLDLQTMRALGVPGF